MGSGGEKGTTQTYLFITAADLRQTGFTAAEGNQFAGMQVKVEGINSIEPSIGKQDRREIRSIPPDRTMRRNVDNGTRRRLFNKSRNGCLIFQITISIDHLRYRCCFFQRAL